MESGEKIKLLKELTLLSKVSETQLAKLSDYLAPHSYADGQVVFEEGSAGDSLYFISSGHVRIAKKLDPGKKGSELKELAILGPHDCFGEMALIEAQERSADAVAVGETILFRLSREDLARWLLSDAKLALGFFAQLVQILSSRLRKSSVELTLLYDLSHWLLEPFENGKALLTKVVEQMLPHLDGAWCAGAYLYNEFNDEMDLVAIYGDFSAVEGAYPAARTNDRNVWLDEKTYQVVFPGKRRIQGYILFHRQAPLGGEERNELGRTLTTTGRLVASALENINHHMEEVLRSRLKSSIQSGGL